MTLFLDANIIIYLVEGTKALQERAVKALEEYQTADEVIAVSRLSWLECRVRPLREKNKTALTEYEKFFAARYLVIVDLTAAVVDTATQLRAADAARKDTFSRAPSRPGDIRESCV